MKTASKKASPKMGMKKKMAPMSKKSASMPSMSPMMKKGGSMKKCKNGCY